MTLLVAVLVTVAVVAGLPHAHAKAARAPEIAAAATGAWHNTAAPLCAVCTAPGRQSHALLAAGLSVRFALGAPPSRPDGVLAAVPARSLAPPATRAPPRTA